MTRIKLISILGAGAVVLAACGGGSGVLSGVAALGAGFANAFGTSANGAPLSDVDSAGLTVDPTAEPFDV
ncbi:hypothetical protein [Sulfitobacter sabulilitoris]|uniref:Uncharacterized protein n=1 Tax=Sulfitobacter sabulilitoris TaxID=2562655 RepID=A0A5S3PD82_9RHOB|nr:hypothetical protein [Sulfitobacter sabulilitoris]TMM51786.1 hypothetical protein FDT80_13645 [Sulfitobacter sabulilitoris]